MEFKEIQELLRQVNKLNLAEVSIEKDDIKLTIKTHSAPQISVSQQLAPAAVAMMPQAVATPAPQAAPTAQSKPAEPPASNHITIKSPMIGTFYRSPGPDKPSFVNVGDEIKPGSVLCIIEAMKLFNEIESEQTGRIVKILVENAQPVEYDQPLFVVEPV